MSLSQKVLETIIREYPAPRFFTLKELWAVYFPNEKKNTINMYVYRFRDQGILVCEYDKWSIAEGGNGVTTVEVLKEVIMSISHKRDGLKLFTPFGLSFKVVYNNESKPMGVIAITDRNDK